MSELKYWLWLSAVPVGCAAKAALIKHFGDAAAAFHSSGGFASVEGVSASEARLFERRELERSDNILSLCDENGINVITMEDSRYPARLKSIYAPPPVLYVKGRLPAIDNNAVISVIGTRRATVYGIKMGRSLAYEICRCGGVVASGFTSGVDSAAVEGALRAEGSAVAVLATPLDRLDRRRAEDICVHGALISEYAPQTKTLKSHFIERNRLAAGLSVGVVVIEAPADSGAILFAHEAAEQGKEIFAVPGNADSETSAGTIALLKAGARPVTCGWDVLSEFERLYPEKLHQNNSRQTPKWEIDTKTVPVSTKKAVDSERDAGYIDMKERLAELSEDQKKIVTALQGGVSYVDELIQLTGYSTAKLLAQLTVLEIKGVVSHDDARRIVLAKK